MDGQRKEKGRAGQIVQRQHENHAASELGTFSRWVTMMLVMMGMIKMMRRMMILMMGVGGGSNTRAAEGDVHVEDSADVSEHQSGFFFFPRLKMLNM